MIRYFPAIRAYRRPAHLLILHRAETPLARNVTKFGGVPYLLENESWAVCSRCHEPLAFVFQANSADLHASLRLGRYNLLTFYYCLSCCPGYSGDGIGYSLRLRQMAPQDTLQAVPFALRRDEANEPTECAAVLRPIEDLPPAEAVVRILGTDENTLQEYQARLQALRGGSLSASKIGGYAHWLQAEPTVRCRCGATMRFWAQVGSEAEANLLWGANGILYILYCPKLCGGDPLGFLIQSP